MKRIKRLLPVPVLIVLLSLCGCSSQQSQLEYITQQTAQSLALEASGLSESDVSITSAALENRNGTDYYRIEFAVNGKSYQCDIDALTGTVIEMSEFSAGSTDDTDNDDTDNTGDAVDSSAQQAASGSSGTITASKAREIALAQVPGASASDIREFETDYDDGHLEYEGTIIYNGMEYEFTIDGYSGAIREWEADSL